jgi:hypothetical protein
VKHGALKSLKQRKSARHLQRRAERQRPESRDERRTRKMQRQADYIALQARVEETMKPEKARQEQNRIKKMLGWFSRYPGIEENDETTTTVSDDPQDGSGTTSLVGDESTADQDAGRDDVRVDSESDPNA